MKTEMKELHLKRLEKLANHLLHGKLGHDIFDFSRLNENVESGEEFKKNGCGTIGCALGECPIIFKQWHFDYCNEPTLKGKEYTEESAEQFFHISWQEAKHLFYPNEQNPILYMGNNLGIRAKKEQVANNMLEFIKLKRNENRT